MKSKVSHIYNSVSDFHSAMNLKKPTNPLVSVIKLEDINPESSAGLESITYNFYSIYVKKKFDARIKYGQQYYDFDNGTMSFFAPKQTFIIERNPPVTVEGWMLIIHPDFLYGNPLSKTIKDYGFFDYATNEALHLSEAED